MQTAMDKLGISLTDSAGNMKSLEELTNNLRGAFAGLTEAEKTKYAATIAGKTGMSGLLAIVNSTEESYKKLTSAVYDNERVSTAAYDMYSVANDNLAGQLTTLKSAIEVSAYQIGQRLTPHIGKLTDFVQGLADKFNSLSDEQLDTIIKFAGIAAAIGPALIVVGKATTGFGKLLKSTKSIVKGIKAVRSAFSSVSSFIGVLNPKLLLVVAIVGAIAAVAYVVYKNWDKIKPFFVNLGEKITEVVGKVSARFSKLKEDGAKFVNKINRYVSMFITKFVNAKTYLGAVILNIKDYFNGIKTALGGVISFVSGVFTGNWSKAWQGIKDIFKGIFGSIASVVKAPLNAVIGLINGAIGAVNKLSFTVPEWVPGLGGKTFGASLPKIPYLYKGTNFFSGGPAVIHDKGAEIVDLPRGTRVIPHDKSLNEAYKMGKNSGKGKSVTIAKLADTIIVREETDIDKIVDELARRLEDASDDYDDVA